MGMLGKGFCDAITKKMSGGGDAMPEMDPAREARHLAMHELMSAMKGGDAPKALDCWDRLFATAEAMPHEASESEGQ